MSNRFYDIHCHAMNLSHPNLLSFIKRIKLGLLLLLTPVVGPFLGIFGKDKINRTLNLLSVMENDIADFFLIMEFFLRNKVVEQDSNLNLNDTKIILTPLMMDFGSKNIRSGTFYNIPPQKPVVEQVVDVFNGIRKYSKYNLVEVDQEYKYIDEEKDNKLFEIYPFLGINTKNYDIDRVEKMLDKYFKEYSGKRDDLYQNMGEFTGNIETIGSNFFAGIKVYPPLGYDPWPEDTEERKKVEKIYDYCCEKKIPVTTHCSDGGFKVVDKAREFTAPQKWRNVLERYPELKINFAHFAKQQNVLKLFPRRKWQKALLKMVSDYPNVYTDFSCNAFDDKYYNCLSKIIDKHPDSNKLKERVLFGTDFMINLMWTDSYNEYLNIFTKTRHFSDDEKKYFCLRNPERFLFNS